jgi:hypothetical protein
MTNREWYDALDGLDQRIVLSMAKVGYSLTAIKARQGTAPWQSERLRRARLLKYDAEFMDRARAAHPGASDQQIHSVLREVALT